MSLMSLLSPILHDEALTRGLGDAEARLLVEWLVERTEARHDQVGDAGPVQAEVVTLRRRARTIGRFVSLWCHERQYAAATQLAATERFPWPLPPGPADPYDLMSDILQWETDACATRQRKI